MSREARRSRRRWRRLRRDLPHLPLPQREVMPDYILTHAGITAIAVEPGVPSPASASRR